jgi:hypothetical protein
MWEMDSERKIDKLIAEKVFGQSVVITRWGKQRQYGCISVGETDYYDDAGEMILSNGVPCYSTDITAAMEVFNHIRDSGKFCCLQILSDFNHNWEIRLAQEIETTEPPHTYKLYASGESLPRVICEAALRIYGKTPKTKKR